MSIDNLFLILTNIALVIATGFAVWASVREGHRHEEHMADEQASANDREDERLVHVIDKVLEERDNHSKSSS